MIGVNSNMKEATLAKHKWQHSTGSSPLVAHTVRAEAPVGLLQTQQNLEEALLKEQEHLDYWGLFMSS